MKNEIVAFIKMLKLLLVKPEQFFSELVERPYDRDAFLRTSFYPVLGLFSLFVFITGTINREMIVGIKNALAVAFPYLAALFVSDYLIRRLSQKMLKRELASSLIFQTVAYCLIVMMVIGIATTIVPFFFILNVLYLYVFYLFFIACRVALDVDIDKHGWFYICASFSILATPTIFIWFIKLFY